VRYLLLIRGDESAAAHADDGCGGWSERMLGRGVLRGGGGLRPPAQGKAVRVRRRQLLLCDGPFAETKEQVAGYDVIDCPDLDAAVAVAAAHPTTPVGCIEVRPFAEGMPDPVVPEQVPDGRLRYLMLVCADMRGVDQRKEMPSPELADPPPFDDVPDDVDAWIEGVGDRRLYGWPLEDPDAAVTVRRVDGAVVTTDGPFAETKEQIAGYDLLECADLDEALEAAASHPVAGGGVLELRPLWL